MLNTKFSKSFDEALEQGYVFQSQFVADQADFTAFSPQFATPFETDFLTDLQAADALPTNEDDLNHQLYLTAQVDAKKEACREFYKKLITYVRLAWPNNIPIEEEFGIRNYEKARKSDVKLINFMQEAYRTADSAEFKGNLIAAGFLQTDIDNLSTLADELDAANHEQEEYINQSARRSEARVSAFNKFWDTMAKISEVSKVIYKSSPAKIETYLLYPEAPTPLPPAPPVNLAYEPSTHTASWDAAAGATSYQLVYKLTIDADWLEGYAGTDTSVVFNPGDGIWEFKVRARNAGGYGDWSDIVTVQLPSSLPPPSDVAVTNETTPTVRNIISFTASPDTDSIDVYVSIVPLGAAEGMYNFDGNFSTVSPIERAVGTGMRYWYYLIAKNPAQSSLESVHIYVDVN